MLTIYKASAGSGKTFQLAMYYLKMVLGVKDVNGAWRLNPRLRTDVPSHAHRHILAITFTNKATEEMKSRIIDSLNAVATAQDRNAHPYIGPLMDTFGCSFEELTGAARNALTSILIDFSFFNVSTIDSFFQTVLRTFARELGIQGDYNIEIDSSEAISRAMNIMLEDLSIHGNSKDNPLMQRVHKWLQTVSNNKSEKFNPFKRQSKDFSELVKLVRPIFREDFRHLQNEMVEYFEEPARLEAFKKALQSIVDGMVAEMKRIGDKAETAIKMSGQYDSMDSRFRNNITALVEGTANLDSTPAAFARLINGERDPKNIEYKLLKKEQPNETYLAAIDELASDLREKYSLYPLAKRLLAKIPTLEFISLLIKYIDKLKEDENLIILDDTANYISRIINGSEIPFIYEHLGSHLQHFLIDEFQDTSRLQWQNLVPLVQNSHASGDDSLIIGDVKQAIYRFRNSDATILGYDLENIDFPDEEGRLIRGTTETENCNYRTAHGIVRFNNTIMPLFASLALGKENPSGYVGGEVVQMCAPARADLDGHIALFPCDMKLGEKDDYVPPTEFSGGPLDMPVIGDEQTKIKVLVEQIRRQHEVEGYALKDIAVLLRKKKPAPAIVKALLDAGINVQSGESLYLKNSKSVRLLESLLRMLVTAGTSDAPKVESNTSDNTERNVTAKMEQVLFESRYNFFLYQGGPNGTPLTPQEAIHRALDPDTPAEVYLNGDDEEGTKLPVSLQETIYSILHKHPATLVATIEAILSAGLIPRATIDEEKDYISAFTDLAIEYSESHNNDLVGFLNWWGMYKEKATIVPPPDCEAVNIMTIHASKGLEFKCVHLFDFKWSLEDDRDDLWVDIRPGDAANPYSIDMGIPRDIVPPLIFFRPKASEMDFPGSPLKTLLEKEIYLMRTDALNSAYVGLTRAKNSLSVYYDIKTESRGQRNSAKINTVGDVLSAVLESLYETPESRDSRLYLDLPPEAYNPDTRAFELHVAATKAASVPQEDKTHGKEEESLSIDEWSRLLNTKYTSTFRSDMSSIVSVESFEPGGESVEDDEDSPAQDTMTTADIIERRKKLKMEKTQRGLDLHEILSHITSVGSAESVDDVIADAIEKSAVSEGFNTDAREEYRTIVRQMLANPETSRWFEAARRVDTELVYHLPLPADADSDSNRLSITRRIDRLVELPDGSLEVVDYKFTQVQDIEYNRQVADYVHDLRKMFPGRRVSGYLWYYDLGLIQTVE